MVSCFRIDEPVDDFVTRRVDDVLRMFSNSLETLPSAGYRCLINSGSFMPKGNGRWCPDEALVQLALSNRDLGRKLVLMALSEVKEAPDSYDSWYSKSHFKRCVHRKGDIERESVEGLTRRLMLEMLNMIDEETEGQFRERIRSEQDDPDKTSYELNEEWADEQYKQRCNKLRYNGKEPIKLKPAFRKLEMQ